MKLLGEAVDEVRIQEQKQPGIETYKIHLVEKRS
ncbi:hypothetical protein [Paenibacillus sp. OSY-SE]